jgi:putative endonuclease
MPVLCEDIQTEIVIPAKAGIQYRGNKNAALDNLHSGLFYKRMTKQYYVYILTNRRNGALYTGVTGELPSRTWQHKEKVVEGFTKKYGICCLIFYEARDNPEAAIRREKQIKKWQRQWKINLIEGFNPAWKDLFEEVCA